MDVINIILIIVIILIIISLLYFCLFKNKLKGAGLQELTNERDRLIIYKNELIRIKNSLENEPIINKERIYNINMELTKINDRIHELNKKIISCSENKYIQSLVLASKFMDDDSINNLKQTSKMFKDIIDEYKYNVESMSYKNAKRKYKNLEIYHVYDKKYMKDIDEAINDGKYVKVRIPVFNLGINDNLKIEYTNKIEVKYYKKIDDILYIVTKDINTDGDRLTIVGSGLIDNVPYNKPEDITHIVARGNITFANDSLQSFKNVYNFDSQGEFNFLDLMRFGLNINKVLYIDCESAKDLANHPIVSDDENIYYDNEDDEIYLMTSDIFNHDFSDYIYICDDYYNDSWY
jgi:hypothetical protein